MGRTEVTEKILPEEFSGELLVRNPTKARQILEKTFGQTLNSHKDQLQLLLDICRIFEAGYDAYGWLRLQEGGGDFFRELEIKFRDRLGNMVVVEELGKKYGGTVPKMSLADKNLKREACEWCGGKHETVVIEIIERRRYTRAETYISHTTGREGIREISREIKRKGTLKAYCGRIELDLQEEL